MRGGGGRGEHRGRRYGNNAGCQHDQRQRAAEGVESGTASPMWCSAGLGRVDFDSIVRLH